MKMKTVVVVVVVIVFTYMILFNGLLQKSPNTIQASLTKKFISANGRIIIRMYRKEVILKLSKTKKYQIVRIL